MVTNDAREQAVQDQIAQQKAEDRKNQEIQNQINNSDKNFQVPPAYQKDEKGINIYPGGIKGPVQNLQDLYRQSGVVFDQNNNVLYNPADLGNKESVIAARNEGRPTPILTGSPSNSYLTSVASAGGNIQDIINQQSALKGVDADKIGRAHV